MKKQEGYHISASVNGEILEAVLTGKLVTDEVEKLQIQITELLIAKEARALLADFRAVDVSEVSLSEIYLAARRQIYNRPKRPTAVIAREEDEDLASFLETTAYNAGWILKTFTDVESARAWLKEKLKKK